MERNDVKNILQWYSLNKRELPWRADKNPYYIWVSEIMLQQTRVEAVKPYFDRFVATLPDETSLATCPEQKLLKLWEGLGFYNRVRNMQKAAKKMVAMGEMPRAYKDLLQLDGIGEYTAAAISSIAYAENVPAVDGNLLRIFARVRADASDCKKETTKKELRKYLLQIMDDAKDLPGYDAGDFNQALMDLGATVCIPNGEPGCSICPLQPCCKAFQQGSVKEYPIRSKPKERRKERLTVFLIRDGNKILMHKRPPRGLLANLLEFPNCKGHLTKEEALQYVQSFFLQPLFIRRLFDAKHIFSHVEWKMIGYEIRISDTEFDDIVQTKEKEGYYLLELEELKRDYPIPSAFYQYAKYLDVSLGIKDK